MRESLTENSDSRKESLVVVLAFVLLLLVAPPRHQAPRPTQTPQSLSIGEPIELSEEEMDQVTGPTATQAELDIWRCRLRK